MGLKQPGLGIAATVLIMAVALAFVSLFDFAAFTGWVAYFLLCVIPIQIVMAITWAGAHPRSASRASQPARGLMMTVVALIVGAIAAAAALRLAGGGISPPTPMLAHWAIVAVPITFWAAIMWNGWPFTRLTTNTVVAGIAMLVVCYVVNHLLFRMLFNYEFMQGAPVYVPALDPHGMFNAWSALVFYVTALAAMFLMLSFDLWPLTKFPTVMQQPMLGLVWTVIALVLGAVAFVVGVNVLHMDTVAFMVKVPVPFIFGTIVVLNMLQNSLFGKLAQPMKGVMNVIAVVIVGTVLSLLYGALAPAVTGRLNAGPPTYDFEIWLASALLSVTFPFLIFYAEFFKFWPLAESPAPQPAPASAAH